VGVIMPILLAFFEILRRLGLKIMEKREQRLEDLEQHLGDLEDRMEGDHAGVSEEVGDLHEEVRALRRDLER
jgi:HAMP domain-containing protein